MSAPNLKQIVGRNVRHYRLKRGISQSSLAKAVGCSRQWLSSVEAGATMLNTGHLEAFSRELGVEIGELLTWHSLEREIRKGDQRVVVKILRTIV